MGWAFQEEELLLLSIPVSADALEYAGAVVKGMGHEPELDVVVAAVLAVVVDPGVRMDSRLLGCRLWFGLHAHLSPSVSRSRVGHITHVPPLQSVVPAPFLL